jgi:hypothetical protein
VENMEIFESWVKITGANSNKIFKKKNKSKYSH